MLRFRSLPALASLLLAAGAGFAQPVPVPLQTAPVAPPIAAEAAGPVTILVSIDGFRPDYLRRGNTPTLDALAADGASGAMQPSFPTLTFPNHYALVTGLRPDRNGIVSNTMEDPAKPGVQFTISDTKVSHDPFWWNGAEPIWLTAERAGIRTGTMFWPGADVAIRGMRPSVWIPYDAAITSNERVDFVIDWLRRPLAERPRLLTLYFDVVDKRSHNQGFDSPEKTQAIREVDAAMARLRERLAAIGQPANLVIVSDHGMEPVPVDTRIDPATVIDAATMRATVEGPLLWIYPLQPGGSLARVVGRRPHFSCWTRDRLPARFHYGTNPRVPPAMCLADTGWRFSTRGADTYVRGDHGYDVDDPAMRALFIGNGPAFRAGRTLPLFPNVDVAPLLRRLVGLPAGEGLDGTDAPFQTVLKR